jgi:hypothetical protein
MSRKSLLTLAAAATLAAATLSTQSANAMGFGRGGFGGGGGFARSIGRGPIGTGPHFPIGRIGRIGGPGLSVLPPRHPIVPIPIPVGGPHLPPPWWHHHHHHWAFHGGHWILIEDADVVDAPVEEPAVAPGPCTCLTKTYTQTGLVVFADVCTKESASAPVDAAVTGEATQEPTTPVAASAVPMSVVPTAPNYAGRTYEDYLAANGQAPQAAAPQSPAAPQKN